MGACCGCDGKSDLDEQELEVNVQDSKRSGHKYIKSWHDELTLDQKKKIAKENQHSECFVCKCCGIFGRWSGLQCCCCAFNNDRPFLSVNKDRHCTDIPCCLLFVLTLIVQLALVLYAVSTLEADPRWLIYYADYNGTLCAPGEYGDTAGNYAAWPDIRIYDVRICVEHCNDTVSDSRVVTPSWDSDIDASVGIYPNGTEFEVDVSGYESINVFDAYCIPNPAYIADITSTVLDADYSEFQGKLDTLTDEVSLAINDVRTAWLLFIISALTALIVSMCWGVAIRWIGSVIIWVSIICTLAGMGLIAYGLVTYSAYAYVFGYNKIGDFMYYSGIIIAVIDGMFALAVCFMWHRIRLAIALAKETTRALHDVLTMFLYPIVPFIFFLLYFAYWCVGGGVFMASVTVKREWPIPEGYKLPYYEGGPTLQETLDLPDEDANYVYLEVDDNWQYVLLFHYFVLLWMVHFISYHTYMVIAGVYAEWYFADWKDAKETVKWRGSDEDVLVIDDQVVRDDSDLERVKTKQQGLAPPQGKNQKEMEEKAAGEMKTIAKLSHFPVFQSFKRVTFYHMGSLAFASLLIAIIEFIEHTLTYFEKKFRNAEPSPMQKMILALIKCVLRCIKCILNRINKNGLVITSIYGWPFCAASMKGIVIVLKNVVRASALSMVSGYLEKLGKICILSINIGLSVAFARYYYAEQLSTVLLPALICGGITFIICWQYMHLYEVGISAIFICFLIDEERNKSLQEMKASKRLRKIIGAHKPPKRYLIEQAKSARGAGLMDKSQVEHFAGEDEYDRADRKAFMSVGNLNYTEVFAAGDNQDGVEMQKVGHAGKSPSVDLSMSIHEEHQKQITEYEQEQEAKRRGKLEQDMMQPSMLDQTARHINNNQQAKGKKYAFGSGGKGKRGSTQL